MPEYFRNIKHNKAIIAVLLVTFLLCTLRPSGYEYFKNYKAENGLFFVDSGFLPINIFVVNSIVAVCIFYLGFFSCGIFSITVWLWNILLLYSTIKALPIDNFDFLTILYSCKHAILEIYAFMLVTVVNFRSVNFYKSLFMSNVFRADLLPATSELFRPFFYLFCAALLESI